MQNNKNLIEIITLLKNLTLLEASELVKLIEQTFDIDLTKGKISSPQVSAILTNENKTDTEEKTEFNVILTEVAADKKIAVLKCVRNITGLGLKESKEIVDTIPKILKETISKIEAETIKKEIELAGGKIEIK
jgi:large subunit ribosomal protein L7/L12